MAVETLRTAVIGVGHQGRYHAGKYAVLPQSRFVGVVDRDKNRRDAVATEFGVPEFSDYKKLIDEVDAVSIAVPTADHFEIAHVFLSNGVHVLLEKPICRTLEEATKLIETANRNKVILQIGHQERFNPAIMALDAAWKPPRFIESYRIEPFKKRGADVSVVLDLMIHDVDLIHSMVRSPIKAMNANGTPVITNDIDIANARIEFENSCVANVTASRASLKTERVIRIFQDDTYTSVDMHHCTLTVYKKCDDAQDCNSALPGINVDNRVFNRGDPLKFEIEAFLNSALTGASPVVSGEEGKRALNTSIKVTEMVNNSYAHMLEAKP